MSNPTDELREKLDELGVEYDTYDLPNGEHGVSWIDGNGIEWEAVQLGENFEIHALQLVTPEQAVAATVGNAGYGIQFADLCEFPPDTMVGETVFDGEGNAIGWIVDATVGKDIERYDGSGRRGTVAILQGGRKPEEVMFVGEDGGVTHYLPEEVVMCRNIAELNRDGIAGYFFVCSECGLAVHANLGIRETNYPYSKPDGSTDLRTFNSNGKYEFERCPRCGRKVTK